MVVKQFDSYYKVGFFSPHLSVGEQDEFIYARVISSRVILRDDLFVEWDRHNKVSDLNSTFYPKGSPRSQDLSVLDGTVQQPAQKCSGAV